VVPLLTVTFHFSTPAGAAGLPFPGAAWRGAFGYALKRTVCVMRPRVCAGCPFERSCAYPYVFETAPGGDARVMQGADRTPRPFVLRLPNAVRGGASGGGEFPLGMTLLGRGIDYLPFIIHALAEAGQRGIGRERTIYDLERVTDGAGEEIWRPGSNLAPQSAAPPNLKLGDLGLVAVAFVSPLRLVRNGAPIGADQLDGPALAFAAVRRVALLRDGFAGALAPIDFHDLRAKSEGARIVQRQLGWSDRRRYSTRQNQPITMGGIVGNLVLDRSGAPGVLPFLETCQFVHIGKGTTLGLGEVALTPV
jgi:hypothetical protein